MPDWQNSCGCDSPALHSMPLRKMKSTRNWPLTWRNHMRLFATKASPSTKRPSERSRNLGIGRICSKEFMQLAIEGTL